MTETVQPKMTDCCKKMKMAHNPVPSEKKKDNRCDAPYCTMMFSCQLCGFIVKEPLKLKPMHAHILSKPVAPHTIGNIAGYQNDSWKPPKAC
jgi:hypothetical protein